MHITFFSRTNSTRPVEQRISLDIRAGHLITRRIVVNVPYVLYSSIERKVDVEGYIQQVGCSVKLPSVVSFTQDFFVSRRRRVYVNPRCREMSRIFGIRNTCVYTNTVSPLVFEKTCWEKCFQTRILPSPHTYFCVWGGTERDYSRNTGHFSCP